MSRVREKQMLERRRALGISIALAFAVIVPSCAPTLKQSPISSVDTEHEAEKQQDMAFNMWVKRQERVDRIAWRLSRASESLCPKTRSGYGIYVHNLASYSKAYQNAARRTYHLGDEIVVRAVVDGMPAAQAGIQAGDTVLDINGTSLAGKSVQEAIALLAKADTKGAPVHLQLHRAGKVVKAAMLPVAICDYPVQVTEDDIVNAYADGTKVFIASGMVRFAESDDELALVIGHEIAHDALGHIQKKKTNAWLGAVVDIAVAAGAGIDTQGIFANAAAQVYSQAFESEADYEGAYLAARAGYDVALAPEFWRRMGAEHPGAIKKNFMASHPSSPERFLRLENTVKEIEAKRADGRDLVPDKASGR